jgi:hypothetical protein
VILLSPARRSAAGAAQINQTTLIAGNAAHEPPWARAWRFIWLVHLREEKRT